MQLPDLFSKISKDKIPFIIGGIFVGALALWVFGKVLTPWVRPVIKDACLTILELKQDRNGAGERVVDIEAIRVGLETMSKRIVTVGKLRANEEVMLRSEMAGRISEITFTEGEEVNKGDILVRFENADLSAEVSLAEAELTKAQADHDRITKLRNQNIESIKRFDETKALLAIAEAKLEKARSQLEKSMIVAPFSGKIGLIDISVGAYVQAAQDIVKLVDSTPIKIDFKVPEQNVHDVGVGQTAEIKIDGFSDDLVIATVVSVDASLDTVSHSLSLRATTPNENGRLRAGMFANISLIVGEKGNAMVVSESAVIRDGEREFVWIVKNGKAGRRRVLTGTREKGKVEIIQGLHVDELVVTAGQIKLGEGTNVNVTNLEPIEAALKEEGQVKPAAPAPTAKEAPKAATPTPAPIAKEEAPKAATPTSAPIAKEEAPKAATPAPTPIAKEAPKAVTLDPTSKITTPTTASTTLTKTAQNSSKEDQDKVQEGADAVKVLSSKNKEQGNRP